MIKDIKELNFPAYATLETATATISDMGDRTITSQVKIAGDVVPDFSYDWEVEFKGERYIHPVRTPQGTKDNSSRKSKIDLVFHHWAIYEMKRQYFVEMASTTAGTAIVDKYIASLGLNLGDFITAFNLVLNHYFGGRIIINLNPEWQYNAEAQFVSISYSYIWDVLQQMHEIYGVRWTLKTNADGVCEILMGYPAEEVSHIFEYGFEGGLLSVQRQVQSTDIRNRLLGRGGSKNLPYRYFKDKDPNNPLFEADPDWIPELANIAFTELRGKTFRDYVRGWKAKRYGGTPMAEPTEAYLIGYNADKFDPIEYVDDKESIEKYGVLVGALENNEEIYPSIQGAPGDVDMIVDAEQVTDDDVDSAVENDSVISNIQDTKVSGKAKANETIYLSTSYNPYFTVPEGKVGNIEFAVSVSGINALNESTAPIKESHTVIITDAATLERKFVLDNVSSVVNIPAGSYRFGVTANVNSNCDEASSISLNVHSIKLYCSTPDNAEGWRQTFDIWVRNIWGSSRNAGETDQQYADRVWLPILGDRMGDEARVVFASGWLSFSSDWEFPIVGYAYDDSKTDSHWRLTLEKSEAELEASGKYIPYEGYNASAGDRFFFIGIDMPHQYVLWGEEGVDDYKRDRLSQTARINPSWVIKTDKVRLNQNREGAKLIDSLSAGAQIRLASKQFISGAYESLYVQSMTYNWTADTILYPDVEVVVSDKVHTVKNPVAQIQGNIETLQRQMGSLSNIQQIIRQVCDQLYLRKDGIEDLSKSPTRFLGKVTGEKFHQGQIGGRDWGIYRDENGNAIFEADKLVARQGILVSDLVVNEATYVGGLQINSAAAMKVTAVEETGDGYVCYFDQKQGTVVNAFKVDDVVLCQKFDPEDNEVKFYKRRVIAVAETSVMLSNTEVSGDGVPATDDVIIHYGNYTDKTRQFVIVRDVIGGGYERMLMGLDSVDSDGVEYYFAGKSADSKARWFVGDDEQYAKYEDGQFTIKGNLFVTGSDKPISYITEALGDGAGGLILGTAIIVGYNDDEGTFVPMAGMSGVFDESRDDGGAAAWYGGVLGNAKIVFNMDGSGYLADGNIRWDKKGAVTFSDKIKISTEGDETLGYILTRLAVFNDMFYWEEEGVTIGTRYNFFSEGQNAAGGIGEEEEGEGIGGGIIDEEMSDDSDNAVANRVIKAYIDALFNDFKDNPSAYIPLKTVNGMMLYGSGDIKIEGGSGEGTSGLTAINVNSQSFQPANGIVTLPDYRPIEYYNQDLAKKVDKVDGKGLSTNDYTTTEKDKLAGIAAGAEVNVQSDWNATSGDAFIKNKPTLSAVATSGLYSDLTGTPRFAVVATSGSYNDLLDKPTIPVEVTEATVAGWGFTKNTGTYIKPTTGIPKSHLASGVQTSLGLADTALQPSALNDYPTTTEVSNALTNALKNYALAQDLTQVDERLADVEAFFDSKDDKDNLVNKWHEIVTFLDATEGDTLDSILSIYAKDADLESAVQKITANETTINTHTTQISTLQGYFTNGKANNADKLDGYESSYFATAANLNKLTSWVSTAEGEIDTLQANNATLMAWYNAVGQHFMYDPVNEAWYLDGDFYATGQNAAGGVGEEEGSTGGGLDEDQLADYLTTNKYVTQTWVSNQGFAKTANLGALASKNSLAFSDLTSKPTTLSGYGITDAIVWDADIDMSQGAKYRHIGYGYPAGGWHGAGPAIAFGISTYYAQIQAGNDTNTPYMFFRPTSNGVTGGTWFRFLFDVGNSNIDSERFSCRGDFVLHRNTADGATFVNYGPYTNDSAALNLYGRVIDLITTDGVLIGGSKVLTESSGDGRYFPLTGNKTITGSVRIESGLTVTGTMYLKGGLFDVPAIYGPPESDYKKWTLFYQTGNDTMYIQAGKNSGTSTDPYKGSIAFSGYDGKNATRVDFLADATYFNGSMSCGALTAKSTTINGTLAVNNHTDINSSMAVDAWLTVGTTLTVTGATSLNSTLSVLGVTTLNSSLTVSGQATLSGGAFLPPSKTIRFQDAATETFTISFDSGVGGLNLSGATRTLGLASFSKGIQIEYGQSIAFVDSNGVKQYITLDEENGAIKVIGNFFATGQNAAGDAGEEYPGMVTSWEDAPDDLTGYTVSAGLVKELRDKVENGGAANVEIKVNALSAYDGRTITTNAMQTLTGLTVDVAQSMLEGAYNKVIDNSGDYPEVWDYTARGTSTGIIIYLRIGDGYDTNTAYALTYTQSAANWSIIMGEI